jgi:hypothetical protein
MEGLKKDLPGCKQRCAHVSHGAQVEEEGVIIGIDPHELSATIEAVDERERMLGGVYRARIGCEAATCGFAPRRGQR